MWDDMWERPSTLKAEEKFGDAVNLKPGELDLVPGFATSFFCDIKQITQFLCAPIPRHSIRIMSEEVHKEKTRAQWGLWSPMSILPFCCSHTQQATLWLHQTLLFFFCFLLVLSTQQQVHLGRHQLFLHAVPRQDLADTIVLWAAKRTCTGARLKATSWHACPASVGTLKGPVWV